MARHSTLQEVKEGALLSKGSTLTIASGIITVTDSFHLVATEGAASSDNLYTINGGHTAGQIVVLMNDGDVVSVKKSTGASGTPDNIFLGDDTHLADDTDTITLMYTGSKWVGLASRSANQPS